MNNLRNLRRKKGYSIQKLHELTGIPFRTLEDWDMENRQITAYHRIKRLSEVLECDMDELMTKQEKCLYGGEKATICLVQEEVGVHIIVFDDEFCESYETMMPREKAIDLLKYMKTNEDVKPFFEK